MLDLFVNDGDVVLYIMDLVELTSIMTKRVAEELIMIRLANFDGERTYKMNYI